MWSILGAVLSWLLGLFTGKKRETAERLGAAEAQNEAMREGIETIRRANEAAKHAEDQEHDPNDLDAPRR